MRKHREKLLAYQYVRFKGDEMIHKERRDGWRMYKGVMFRSNLLPAISLNSFAGWCSHFGTTRYLYGQNDIYRGWPMRQLACNL